jgi:hypothetical protein
MAGNEPPPGESNLSRPLRDVLQGAATLLEDQASQLGLQYVNERDHLAKCWRRALSIRTMETDLRTAHQGERRMRDIDEWRGVGDVDSLLARGDVERAFVELKCGRGRDAAAACAWDALKMALALRVGRASEAYLVAGARMSDWLTPIRGTEFLVDGSHAAHGIRRRFADWWRHWELSGDPLPLRLPAALSTWHIDSATFPVAGTEWQLRLSRVTVEGGDWYDWSPESRT